MFRYIVFSFLIVDLIFNVEGCSSIASFVEFVSDPITPKNEFGDNLVIIGGYQTIYGVPNDLSDIEAVRLDDDKINCDPTDLPYKVSFHASVYTPVLDGILTCGGEDEKANAISKCVILRKGNDTNHFPALNSKRFGLSLTSTSDTIYAIGGFPNKNTMETINLNTDKQWKQEELPFSVVAHCSVRLGKKIIVTGGRDENGNTLDTTWIYDVVSKSWSEGPKMNTKREAHACFTDKASSSIYIAGGESEGEDEWINGWMNQDESRMNQWHYLSSTEKWTFDENGCQPSANLPEAISWSSAVSSNTDEYIGYIAGGYNPNLENNPDIYGLKRRQMEWIKLNETMETGRKGHSLLNIPANQISGC